MKVAPTLPTEVCEQVMDKIAEDLLQTNIYFRDVNFSQLTSCALVCRAWLPRSRYHMYRFIRIKSPEDLSMFRAITQQSSCASLRFLGIYPSEFPHPSGKHNETSPLNSSWISSIPIQISSAIRQLEVLSISNVDMRNTHPKFNAALSVARTTEIIELCQLTFASFTGLIRTVSSFQKLRTLVLVGICISPLTTTGYSDNRHRQKPYDPFSRSLVPVLSDLMVVRIDPVVTNQLLTWLKDAFFLYELKRLVLDAHCLSPSSAKATQEFINECDALQIVAFLGSNSISPLDVASLDLSHAPNLTSLSLDIRGLSPSYTSFLGTLKSIHSSSKSSLTEVAIAFPSMVDGNVDIPPDFPWTEVDNILNHERYSNLAVLNLYFQIHIWKHIIGVADRMEEIEGELERAVEDIVCKYMPKWSLRNCHLHLFV
ncbi:hypothetical protein C8Q75DRAFT_773668 [Abortiporus biennis]|nr:hypothetical protein C8Q75DRAFT_773668 [Abortiporus biennis]